jgi:predicted kinase
MKQELPICIDNTNYNKKNRKTWISLAQKYNYKINAVVMKTLFDECIERNSKRERQVPTEIIRKHFDGFEEPTIEEGFNNISYV